MSSDGFYDNRNRNGGLPLPPFPGDTPSGRGEAPRWQEDSPRPKRFSLLAVLGKFCSWCAVLMSLGMVLAIILSAIGLCALFTAISDSSGGSDTEVTEKVLSGTDLSPKKIVILPIEGTITENEDGFVRHAIQKAYEDKRVAGLILRVDSPGGTIAGSDYYYKLLCDVKKERKIPVYVSMGGIAASGGYYVSMAGDKIFAERSTMTGSIGVIFMLFDVSNLCEKIGVSSNYITSGKHKGMGDMTKPMSEEERRIWQGMIDESYEQFLAVIREGRPCFAEKSESAEDAEEENAEPAENTEVTDDAEETVPEETAAAETPAESVPQKDLREIADGRIYSAAEAKKLGLIDEIGFLQDTVETMIKDELGVDENDVQVVRYKKSEGILGMIAQEREEGSAAAQVRALIGSAASPNLYYLPAGTFPLNKD